MNTLRALAAASRLAGSPRAAAALGALGVGAAGAYCWALGVPRVQASSGEQDDSASDTSLRTPDLCALRAPADRVYSPESTTVVFVLGGPGVGKGTQCARIVAEFDFVHLSAGDLLRDERQRPGSPYSELIEHYIREGKIIPQEITISLLLAAMRANPTKTRFLIDGFPRSIDQGIEFEACVCPSKAVFFFECGEEEMLKRLMGRSQVSDRSDDNIESIRKRLRVFQESTIPVREFYHDLGKLQPIDCAGSIEQVYERTKSAIKALDRV